MNVGSGKEISIRDRAVLIAGVEQYGGEFTWDTTKPNGTPRKLIMDNSLMFAPMATAAAFAEDHHESMKGFADLTDRFRQAFETGDYEEIDSVINANFELRRSIMELNPEHIALIEEARSVGASAKFTGSGGAIIGTCHDEAMFAHLVEVLGRRGVEVIKPEIVY